MGMTLALHLAQKGYQVTILEAAPEPGGLAGAKEMDGMVWDKFYHVILMSDLNTRRIIKRRSVLSTKLTGRDQKPEFFSDGKLYSMSNVVEYS